jgi:hypothetical protein
MSRVREYNEGDTIDVTFSFFDPDWVFATPTTVRYRIHCLTENRTVREWTSLTPSQSVEIAIASSDNAIINAGNVRERKQVQVQVYTGLSTQKTHTREWFVKNLQGVD